MNQAKGRTRLRRWKRLAIVCIAVPIALLVLVNLFFATSWGTRLITDPLSKRINLPCQIDRVSWSPWGGGQIHQLVVSSAREDVQKDLLVVERIKVDLSWLSLIKGKKRFDHLDVRGVRMDLTLEELKELFASNQQFEPLVDQQFQEEGGPNIPEVPSNGGEYEGPFIPRPEPRQVQAPDDSPERQVVPVDDFEGMITMSDVEVRLSSEKLPHLAFEWSGMSAEIPIWGREREGMIDFGHVRMGDDGAEEKLAFPILWKEGFLQVAEPRLHVLGLHMNLKAALQVGYGLAYGVEVSVPPQHVDFTALGASAPSIWIGEVVSESRLQGYLMKPSLVYGNSHTLINQCVMTDPQDGSKVVFDAGLAMFTVSSGGLYAQDCRLVGEEEAFLANGFLTSSGQGAATLRVVANPQRAEAYEKRLKAANASWTLALKPLVTEDRLYRDLRLEIGESGLSIDVGPDQQPVSFAEVVKKIRGGPAPLPPLVQ